MNDDLLNLYEKRVDKYIKEKQKNDDLSDYITRLEERIDKSLEYIEKVSDNGTFEISENEVIVLLDILKGNDSNE